MVEGKTEECWLGFACKKCGAPLALQRSNDPPTSGTISATGWRVTCPSCGASEYYERGTAMMKIKI
jgi:uncharacterized protein (DUF983 family)